MKTGCFVFFGPANVGKSSMIGYLYSSYLNKEKYEKEVAIIMETVGDNYRPDRFYSYFVDTSKDEYEKQTNQEISYGTSKKMHLARYGDFDLIDTPGGAEYAKQRYRGLSMASIGIFAIEIGQLIDEQGNGLSAFRSFRQFNDFFSTWFIWKKMHGIQNTIIMLTKYDLYQGQQYYDMAVSNLKNIIGDDVDQTIIVPTGIETEKRSDINVLEKMNEPWYKGMCLLDALKIKCRIMGGDDDNARSLLMIFNEYKTSYSTTAKSRWKVLKGKLIINDKIKIAPIVINDEVDCPFVTVKEIEIDQTPKNEAFAGEIVNVGVSMSDEWDGRLPQIAIATGENDEISLGDVLSLSIPKSEQLSDREWERLNRLKEKQQLSIIWFSGIVQVEISSIVINERQIDMILELVSEKAVALPTNMLPQTVIVQLHVMLANEPAITIRGQVNSISRKE